MIKKISLLLFLALPISLLSGCSGNTPKYIGDISYSFNEGKAVFSFKSEGFNQFNLYQKDGDEFVFKEKINESSFSSDDYRKEFKIVALEGETENSDYSLEFKSYFDGVFANEKVKIFSPSDNHKEIQKYIDDKYSYLAIDEWSTDRVEVLFLPGDYSDITLKNGYYTSFRGLGYSPDDCTFKDLQTVNHPNTGNALINFWRSMENLSFNEDSMWAISQATAIRRAHFKKNLLLSDNRGGNGWSSGGFIANSKIDGIINPGSQQQFLMRNDSFAEWTHSNMNMVFEGCLGHTPSGTWIESRTTVLDEQLDIIEKPYLVFDNQKGFGYVLFNQKHASTGYDWSNDNAEFISLSEFGVLHPEDDMKTINSVFAEKKNILFTPGIYEIDQTIEVTLDNSLIVGMGYATLTGVANLDKIMSVKSANNKLSSLLFQCDAKIGNQLVLEENENNEETLLSDLFFRVGGHSIDPVSVDVSLVINQDNVITDNFWIWRADHGKDSSAGIGYFKNYAKTGCVINGDHVICHALMIEHYYEYQLIWNGEHGEVIFYQSETPYDLPNQTYWMRYKEGYTGEAAFGYPSYKVNNEIIDHKSYGVGIYFINTSGVYEKCYTALETPCNDEIYLKHISARYFGGEGRFVNTINDVKGYEEGLNMTIELFDKNTFPELFGE